MSDVARTRIETRTKAVQTPEKPARRVGLLGLRRNFLINRRYQLRAGILTASVVMVLLVVLNVAMFSASARDRDRASGEAPEFASMLAAQDRIELVLILVASAIFLVGLFVITVLETHKTAGAAFNLGRRMRDVSSGNYTTSLRLRRGDNLTELVPIFNDMAHALREREWHEVEALGQLADAADGEALDPGEIAGRLREMVKTKRQRVDCGIPPSHETDQPATDDALSSRS